MHNSHQDTAAIKLEVNHDDNDFDNSKVWFNNWQSKNVTIKIIYQSKIHFKKINHLSSLNTIQKNCNALRKNSGKKVSKHSKPKKTETILCALCTSFWQMKHNTYCEFKHTVNVMFVADRAPWNMKQTDCGSTQRASSSQNAAPVSTKGPTEQRIKWRSGMSFPSPWCSFMLHCIWIANADLSIVELTYELLSPAQSKQSAFIWRGTWRLLFPLSVAIC